ncbi:TetR/AcrR family transcriptional regulator [Marinitenerispora sediminis]|uniref:TetR family transcriptional regulator n=1 Tax=Marinitenerispora sediminis TaxID=1931232 RepID=A0A368T7J8_9ACTN|nr:TetR/AcrR family transcriptional regulator [Marinitenerispora sediminis]RCV47682.1 TetR family transcriptional regulator [Marinitenerispora sediminis]RCV49102.1 TetR family transcriptional regulator [Marinitenerispora sediminis]RCV57708.1 TetR family transcriptional regulator [Marinitenerispora sediminis]
MEETPRSGRGGGARAARRRAVAAALRLFTEHGYEATTMDDIAAAAGVSRRTLFRHFGSKEDVLFAEHDELFANVARHLAASAHDDPVTAVCAAARMVFQDYVAAPEITVPRYHLVRAVPRLRDREIAMTARYQAAFTGHLAADHTEGPRALAAEALAAAVIAAHNHVLRSWLRDPEHRVPWNRLDEAMAFVTRTLGPVFRDPGGPLEAGGPGAARNGLTGPAARPAPAGPDGSEAVLVAVYPARMDGQDVLRRVSEALGHPAG